MQTAFQLSAVHGMLYTGGNLVFAPDDSLLYSPVHHYVSALQLQHEGHRSYACAESSIQCFDLSPDGDLLLVVGTRGLGFFYALTAEVRLDTIAFPPRCTVAAVRFSPCGRFVAVALEHTLQIYTAPARRVVGFHRCHRLANYHALLVRPICSVEWSADSAHVLVAGEDAGIKIVPRHTPPRVKGTALAQNALIGHRSAVIGAWFVSAAHRAVVSVAKDNVVILWRRTTVPRQEVMHAIARARLRARLGDGDGDGDTDADTDSDPDPDLDPVDIPAGETPKPAASKPKTPNAKTPNPETRPPSSAPLRPGDDGPPDDRPGLPHSLLERQRLARLRAEGVRVGAADDTALPPLLRESFVVGQKFLLPHKGGVAVASFHAPRGLVAIGYDTGLFAIHRVEDGAGSGAAAPAAPPTLPLVHLLSISAQALTAAVFSHRGDRVAFGCAALRQLLVWDWVAETAVVRAQSHAYDLTRVALSADGALVVTGGDDGKVKVWRAATGQSVVTFPEHTAPITGLVTSPATNAVFSTSLDGTARGFDLVRYRCFRSFVAPAAAAGGAADARAGAAVALGCLAIDPAGEVLAVGAAHGPGLFLFAVHTGALLERLLGHAGPLTALAFHPAGTTLVSGAVDVEVLVWELFPAREADGGGGASAGRRRGGAREAIGLGAETLALTYAPSGRRLAVLTARQEVCVFDTVLPTEPVRLASFRVDRDAAGGWQGRVGPGSANYAAGFTRLVFAPDGEWLLAGGEAKWVVLFHAQQGYAARKWPVTENAAVLGAEEQYPWREQTEAGDDLPPDGPEGGGGGKRGAGWEMPGSRVPGFATGRRRTARVARCTDLAFAPTGTSFVAATSDGLLVFSTLHTRTRFRPLQLLEASVTPGRVARDYAAGHVVLGLIGALILVDRPLIRAGLRRMPREAIPVAVSATPSAALVVLIESIADEVARGRGLEQALLWAQSLLLHTGGALAARALIGPGSRLEDPGTRVQPALKELLRALSAHQTLAQLARENTFALRYLADVARLPRRANSGTTTTGKPS